MKSEVRKIDVYIESPIIIEEEGQYDCPDYRKDKILIEGTLIVKPGYFDVLKTCVKMPDYIDYSKYLAHTILFCEKEENPCPCDECGVNKLKFKNLNKSAEEKIRKILERTFDLYKETNEVFICKGIMNYSAVLVNNPASDGIELCVADYTNGWGVSFMASTLAEVADKGTNLHLMRENEDGDCMMSCTITDKGIQEIPQIHVEE